MAAMRKHVDDQDENQRPGEDAGCLGSIAWPEKRPERCAQSWERIARAVFGGGAGRFSHAKAAL